jgi:glutathione synthase/RimK-type ligase-like ATP-grasp enzyme
MQGPIAILYEHPEWFTPLFAEFDRRDVPYEKLHATMHAFDPSDRDPGYGLVLNRMSPSAWLRGAGPALFFTADYLAYLDEIGTPVLNGHRAYRYEISKAAQCSLFAKLGLHYPRTRVINHPARAQRAADGLVFPVLVKPNVGGSGAGIESFAHPDELEQAAASGALRMGPDDTALVQEHLPAEGDSIVRIEILGGEFLYAIGLRFTPGTFNLCPADYCRVPGMDDGVSGRGLPIEACDPPRELIDQAISLVHAAGMDLGGVEYLINARDGKPYFYDLNALSNFVADAPNIIGFDPFVDLVDFILARAGLRTLSGIGAT